MRIHYRKKQNTLYRKVAEDIERMIARGIYKEGTRIPSIRQMSGHFNVSINTIKESYALLETRQLIEGLPQKGYFVKSMNIRKLQVSENQDFYEPVTREIPADRIYQRIMKEILIIFLYLFRM